MPWHGLWQIKTCRSRPQLVGEGRTSKTPPQAVGNTVDWSEVCQLTINLTLVGGVVSGKKMRSSLPAVSRRFHWYLFKLSHYRDG
jgi:hypothetical protein